MVNTINDVIKSEINEIRSLDGQAFEAKQIEHWTMNIIIAVAFGDAFPVKWMADAYQQYSKSMDRLGAWDFLIGKIAHYIPVSYNLKRWKLRKEIEEKILEAVKNRKSQLENMYIKINKK